MRIVHACLRYPPATGGAESYIQEIVQRTYAIDAGRDVRVLTSSMRTHGPVSLLDPNLLLDDPIYVQRLHHAVTPFVSYPRLQALSYYLGHHQPDIVHAYSFWYQPADVAARFARRYHIPFIFHPIYYNHATRKKLIWQLYKQVIGNITFAAADVVVTISPYEQRLIEQDGFTVKRFELIPPGIDVPRYSVTRQNPFRQRGIPGRILLTVSRLSKGKGISDAIRALVEIKKTHDDAGLVIVGEDFGEQFALQQQAQRAGLANSVYFLGKLSDTELIGAYQHATVLIHPTWHETFGIVPAEALASALPVVARNVAALPFVVPHAQAGLLFKNNRELIKHVAALLDNSELGRKLAAAGQSHVAASFSWDKNIKKLIALYSEYDQGRLQARQS